MLCKKFNLQPATIVSHAEAYTKGYASNHADCDHWFSIHGRTMNQFRNLVESILGQSTKYLVRITTDVLNVRKGPGTDYQVVTQVHRGDVYTIVNVHNGFGQLKSGAGWICLDYVKKI